MNNLALAFETAVAGRSCRVERREADWALDLRDNVGLAVGYVLCDSGSRYR